MILNCIRPNWVVPIALAPRSNSVYDGKSISINIPVKAPPREGRPPSDGGMGRREEDAPAMTHPNRRPGRPAPSPSGPGDRRKPGGGYDAGGLDRNPGRAHRPRRGDP